MAVPGLADDDLEYKVPFKAKTEVVSEVLSDACGSEYELALDTEHIGTGTHLGRFQLSETLCVDFGTGEFQVTGTLYTANGDELYFTAANGTGWVFNGGTGRFENAVGQADETLFRDSAGQLIAITAEGSITYNASDSSD